MRRRWAGPWSLDRKNNIWRRPFWVDWITPFSTSTISGTAVSYRGSSQTDAALTVSMGWFHRWVDGPQVKPRKSLSAAREPSQSA